MERLNEGNIKCHKCRHIVLGDISKVYNIETKLVNTHCCSSYDVKKFIYIKEESLPIWIRSKVEEEQWTKGKLHCENCGSKVGSFDFVSGHKCDCGKTVLPAVHLTSSQVDRPVKI